MKFISTLRKILTWIINVIKGNPLPRFENKPKDEEILGTKRDELDVTLEVIEGEIPKDLRGVLYVMGQVGTVNSGGLPYSETLPDGSYNREFGSPIMNGDGMAMSVDFNSDQPLFKSRLMKTPCYYADEASKYGTEHHKLLGFRNFGITRMSLVLGGRNELNTAVIPVRFKYMDKPALLVTYDVGRPFAMDPVTLELITPVGKNKEWVTAEPEQVPWPFGIVQTTAHPMFDPKTSEFFTVNYKRESSDSSSILKDKSLHHARHNANIFERKLERLAKKLHLHSDMNHVRNRVSQFFNNLDEEITGEGTKVNPTPGDCAVYLWRWDGETVPEKWLLKDENGGWLQIKECMHQTGITENHLVLTDCSFKFSVDLLLNNPFPENQTIDRFIRWMLAYPMVPHTKTYVVKRTDLVAGKSEITAYALDESIPVETIHYSCDYKEKDGKINLYGIHNAAVCVAEWIRSYDINQITGKPVDMDFVGMFAIFSMDLSRVGKWVIDPKNAKLLTEESKEFCEAGNMDGPELGPNTWAASLYAHRGLTDAYEVNDEIKYMWYVAAGTDSRLATEFIYELYKNYPNRKLAVDQVIEATKKGLPFTLNRLNTQTWEVDQVFQPAPLQYCRSIQFIPRTPANTANDPQLDGYLVLTMQIGTKTKKGTTKYHSEFWLFDALDITKGPIAKLTNKELLFCFTLHTAWIPEAVTSEWKYNIDIKEDYAEIIDNLPIGDKQMVQAFFTKNVYPHFKVKRKSKA